MSELRAIAPHFYERHYKLSDRTTRRRYYGKFTDWTGRLRTFALGENISDARDRLEILKAKNRLKMNFDEERIAAIESARELLPVSDLNISFEKLFGPCVYVFKEGRTFLYIGTSKSGLRRIADYKHPGIKEVQRHSGVIIKLYFLDDMEHALKLESNLILKHRPLYNRSVNLRLAT